MQVSHISFTLQTYQHINELNTIEANLLHLARTVCHKAYAPYSNFLVGAAGLLTQGKILTGTNQENISYPAGICAERSLLSTAASLYPNTAIEAIAVSYFSKNSANNSPISPCGLCRQSLAEHSNFFKQPIKLILSAQTGLIYVIQDALSLLPFQFAPADLRSM